jgi:hypothetical protein
MPASFDEARPGVERLLDLLRRDPVPRNVRLGIFGPHDLAEYTHSAYHNVVHTWWVRWSLAHSEITTGSSETL